MTPRRVRPTATTNAFIFSDTSVPIRYGWANVYDDGYGYCWHKPVQPTAATKSVLYRIRVIPKEPKP